MKVMIESIVGVWEDVMSAIVGLFNSAQGLFWNSTDSTLTFLGVLSVIGVAIAIVLLVVNLIRDFLQLR